MLVNVTAGLLFHLLHDASCALIEPDDGVVERLASHTVERDRGFSLVRDADGFNLLR